MLRQAWSKRRVVLAFSPESLAAIEAMLSKPGSTVVIYVGKADSLRYLQDPPPMNTAKLLI